MNSPYIAGMGQYGAKLLVVGEAPSDEDNRSGKPFSGAAGREFDNLCKDSGINRNELWLTNVFKHSIPPNVGAKRIPASIRAEQVGINVSESLEELQNEINSIKPNCILGLGSTALWALTGIKPKTKKKETDDRPSYIPTGGIQDYRGSILLGMGRKSVFTYHPKDLTNYSGQGAEFKGYWNRQIMAFDFRRAREESLNPELNLPQRILEICKGSWELTQFRNRYKDLSRLSVDIEAHGSMLPACIGLAFIKNHGMCVPLWNTDGISMIPDSDMVNIWIILAEMLYEKEIIGQNFNYDRDKIRRLGFIIKKLISDTMLKAFAINPELPKGLAFNTSIYTREPFYKNEGMYEGKIEDLFIGCARDACVTLEVNDAMDADLDELGQREYFENFIMHLPEFYLSIENQGFKINTETRDQLLRKYIAWDERLRYELFCLTGEEVNVNSPKQINILLFDVLKCPRRNGTGEDELTSLLNLQSFTDSTKRRVVELVLEDRKVRKSISTYLMAMPDYDGRMRTTYFPCLDTGRSSTGQQDPPIRPMIEVVDENGKKKKKVLGIAFQTMTKHGDIGQDIRSMYVPD